MIFQKILVPMDGSDSSKRALETAIKLIGDDPEATLHILMVVDAGALAIELQHPTRHRENNVMLFPNSDSYQKLIDTTAQSAMEKLESYVGSDVNDVHCAVEMNVALANKVTNGIIDYGKEHHCDLIVMGRRGLGMFRGMLGSASYGVLQSSDLPVLSVK